MQQRQVEHGRLKVSVQRDGTLECLLGELGVASLVSFEVADAEIVVYFGWRPRARGCFPKKLDGRWIIALYQVETPQAVVVSRAIRHLFCKSLRWNRGLGASCSNQRQVRLARQLCIEWPALLKQILYQILSCGIGERQDRHDTQDKNGRDPGNVAGSLPKTLGFAARERRRISTIPLSQRQTNVRFLFRIRIRPEKAHQGCQILPAPVASDQMHLT